MVIRKKTAAILGGMGQMGFPVGDDLVRAGYQVFLIDKGPMGTDVTDRDALLSTIKGADIVVGCLPSHIGRTAMQTVVNEGYNYVDLSFTADDLSEHVTVPEGVVALHDFGLSPGISHMIVGHEMDKRGGIDHLEILVGGISRFPKDPCGYVLTWNGDDLIEEYTRPARFVTRGVQTTADPLDLDGLVRRHFPGVGELEGFLSDGLRSLLKLDIPEMREYTLRWPGHMEGVVTPLMKSGTLLEELPKTGEDMVVLQVNVGSDGEAPGECVARLVDYASGGGSAMARTTAFTCSAAVAAVLEGAFKESGLHPPEHLGANGDAYGFVRSRLKDHGISWDC